MRRREGKEGERKKTSTKQREGEERREGEKQKMSTKMLKTGKIGIFWRISQS